MEREKISRKFVHARLALFCFGANFVSAFLAQGVKEENIFRNAETDIFLL